MWIIGIGKVDSKMLVVLVINVANNDIILCIKRGKRFQVSELVALKNNDDFVCLFVGV